MKKIFIFLCLLTGIVRGQIIGGYIPLNSTKTPTMGGLRITQSTEPQLILQKGASPSNTAIFGFDGTIFYNYSAVATASYAVYTNNTRRLTVSASGNVGIGLGVTEADRPLVVVGTASISGALTAASTMSLGAANLTGGNTGTVSVLSDNIFCVTFNVSNTSPADATTYYLTTIHPYGWNTGGAAVGRYRLPQNCTLTNWTITNLNFGVNGTGENTTFFVRKNDSSNDNLTTTFTFTGGLETSGTVSIDYASGDLINIGVTTPTWATNPTNCGTSVTLWFKRR